jgi:hypothetical protein
MIAEHVTVPSPAYDDGQVQCWVGDALEVLQTMPAHSVLNVDGRRTCK